MNRPHKAVQMINQHGRTLPPLMFTTPSFALRDDAVDHLMQGKRQSRFNVESMTDKGIATC